MKKIFIILCLLAINSSFANGVLCNVTKPLNPSIFVGGSNVFAADCFNNTHNRNYTDFRLFNPNLPGIVAIGTTCPNQQLPVGGHCIITGVFSPSSPSNNQFTFGLHYGGTDYPSYPTLQFSTVVKSIHFVSTNGPSGSDIADFTLIPQTSSGVQNFYVFASNFDLGDVDFFYFNGSEFSRTNFPFSTTTTNIFVPSGVTTSDSTQNLYVGTFNSLNTLITDVYKYNFATGTWASTGFINQGADPVVSLATNSSDRIYAVTENQNDAHTEVWEYDPVLGVWANTSYPFASGNLSSFDLNEVVTYLVPDTNNLLYGIANNTDIFFYTPAATAGTGIWSSTNFPNSVFPRSIAINAANVFAGADAGSAASYDIYSFDGTATWTATLFPAAEPPYPSFLPSQQSGGLYATGDIGAGAQGVFLFDGTTWTNLNFPTTSQAISLQLLQAIPNSTTTKLFVSSLDITSSNISQIWSFDPTIPLWTNQNFPSATNVSFIILLSLDAAGNLYNLMLNGLYQLVGTTWSEHNNGLRGLTNHYALKSDGTLYTLNARQLTSPSCTFVAGYDPNWNDRPDNDGFIDVFQHPRFDSWSSSNFPSDANSNYVFAPLIDRRNTLYATSINQQGTVYDVWRHEFSWISTNFPALAGQVYVCAQNGGLTEDTTNNLYAITNNGNFSVWRFARATSTWAQAATGLPATPTLIEQLISDTNNVIYAIVDNDIFRFNPLSMTWSSTNYFGVRGTPKHILLDKHHNLYAVNQDSQVWKKPAGSQFWPIDSLNFPAATAGTIYQDLVVDELDNLYARTQNGTQNNIWEFVNVSHSWRSLASLPGYPTNAIINRLTSDEVGSIYIATSKGLYVFSGFAWTKLDANYAMDFLSNFADAFYLVTRNQGVLEGRVT